MQIATARQVHLAAAANAFQPCLEPLVVQCSGRRKVERQRHG